MAPRGARFPWLFILGGGLPRAAAVGSRRQTNIWEEFFMNANQQKQIRSIVITGLCLGLGLVLPSIFHMFGAVSGQVFLPMHIPALLCGFTAGPVCGLICGVVLPLLSSVVTGMPAFYPMAITMACELAAYGFFSGLLYRRLGRVYLSLIPAMLAGRAVSGLANWALLGMGGGGYTLSVFLAGAFVKPIPGIIIQLVLVPVLVKALEKSGLVGTKNPAAA